MRSPIVRFRSESGTPYVYDRNSNEIVRLQEPLFQELTRLHVPNEADSAPSSELRTDYLRSEYERARSIGLFADIERPHMISVCCEHCRPKALESLHSITLCVTERCNLRCIYCSHSGLYPRERLHSREIIDLETAKAAIRFLVETSKSDEPLSVSFYGGECMLHFSLLKDIVAYAESIAETRRIQFHFDTNGTLMRPEHVAFFLEHDTYVQISVDGPRAVHDRYRVTHKGTGTFDRVIRALQMIHDADYDYYRRRVRFSVTISPPYRLDEIDQLLESDLLSGHVVTAQLVEPFDTSFYERYETEDDRAEFNLQFSRLRDSFADALVNGHKPSTLARNFFERPLFRIHRRDRIPERGLVPCNGCCVPGCRKLFVDVRGDMRPCERVGQAFVLGNVRTGLDWKRVQALSADYIEMSEDSCATCWAARLCGVCFSSARRGDDLDMERKEISCANQRRMLARSLSMYVSILERNPRAFDYVRDIIFS